MGRILHTYGRLINRTGQTSWSAAGGRGKDLSEDDGQVCSQGGWKRGEGFLWYRATVWGVEAGIEGLIHMMRLLWAQHAQEEYWEVLLIESDDNTVGHLIQVA